MGRGLSWLLLLACLGLASGTVSFTKPAGKWQQWFDGNREPVQYLTWADAACSNTSNKAGNKLFVEFIKSAEGGGGDHCHATCCWPVPSPCACPVADLGPATAAN